MYLAIISGQGLSISLEVLSGATDRFGDLVVRGDFPHPLFYVPVHPLLFVEGLQTPVPSNISEVFQRRHPWTLDLYCDPVPQLLGGLSPLPDLSPRSDFAYELSEISSG